MKQADNCNMTRYSLRIPESLIKDAKETLERHETFSNFVRVAIENEIQTRKCKSGGKK